MGAYTCQFGIVHKTCRCPTQHTIKCDQPEKHGPGQALCLVMQMRLDSRLPTPKHLAFHEPHEWWYTSVGGGHQLYEAPEPGSEDFGRSKKWICLGWSS